MTVLNENVKTEFRGDCTVIIFTDKKRYYCLVNRDPLVSNINYLHNLKVEIISIYEGIDRRLANEIIGVIQPNKKPQTKKLDKYIQMKKSIRKKS